MFSPTSSLEAPPPPPPLALPEGDRLGTSGLEPVGAAEDLHLASLNGGGGKGEGGLGVEEEVEYEVE